MSQNDSHIVVHNHIEGFSNIQILTIVFFVVITFIIVLLLIIAIVILIVVVLRKKNPMKLSDHPSKETLRESTLQTVPKTINGESVSGTGAVNLAAMLNDDNDDDTDINSNSQNIPLSVLRSRLNDHFCDSPESTPSVYENLYPSQHEGEIVSGLQPNTNFAGRVKQKPTLPKSGTATLRPERKPSSARERQSSSLEWDYFESRPYFESKSSDSSDGSEKADKNTVDVCWV